MKNLNKQKLLKEVSEMIVSDDVDYVLNACKKMRLDLIELIKKYAVFEDKNFLLNIKMLKNTKFEICLKCEVDSFMVKSYLN